MVLLSTTHIHGHYISSVLISTWTITVACNWSFYLQSDSIPHPFPTTAKLPSAPWMLWHLPFSLLEDSSQRNFCVLSKSKGRIDSLRMSSPYHPSIVGPQSTVVYGFVSKSVSPLGCYSILQGF